MPLSDRLFSHAVSRTGSQDTVDLATFRQGMRGIAGAVTVLTTSWRGAPYGMTATAVCSLSAEPPRLIACVNQAGQTFEMLRNSRMLAVNVLAENQVDMAMRFAGMLGDVDRVAGTVWRKGQLGGLPVLADTCSTFECRIAEFINSVSHAILICDIIAVEANEGRRPLLYCNGSFAGLGAEVPLG